MKLDATPAEVGIDESKLKLLRASIEDDIANFRSDGSVVIVARYGKVVMHEAIGFTDRASGRKARVDDLLPIMSVTKQMTAAAVLRFIDRGQLSLTTRIAEVIPEFGQAGKERVTVREALSHQAGLPLQLPVQDWENGNEDYVARLCSVPYEQTSPHIANYHAGAAHAVLGEVMRRVDPAKRPVRQIMAEEVFQPVGMKDTTLTFLDRPDLESRFVPIVMRDDSPDALSVSDIKKIGDLCKRVELPSAGAFSTAYDQFLFAEMMRKGGQANGQRVLSPAIIKVATTIQSGDKLHGLFMAAAERDHTDAFPANIGLSFFIRGEGVFVTNMGTLASPQTYAASGFGGQTFWVDPVTDVTFVHLVCGFPQLYNARKRTQRLSDLVHSAIG